MSRRTAAAVAAAVALGGATAPAALAGDPVLEGSGFDSLDGAIALFAPPVVQTSLLAKSAAAQSALLGGGDEGVCAATRTLGALELETAALAGQLDFSLEGASTISDRAEAIVSELRATHPPSPCIPPGPPQLPG